MNRANRVGSYSTDKIISIGMEDDMKDAAKLMVKNNIGSLLVMKENEIKGIITERDYMHSSIKDSPQMVRDWMSHPVYTIYEDAPLHKALEKMLKRSIRRLVVVDDDGKAKGVCSITDILKGTYDTMIEVYL